MSKAKEDANEFFAALGKAISGWQGVEQRMELVFCDVVGSKYAPNIFDAILSTRDKIGVLNDILQIELRGDDLLTDWNDLRERLKKKATKRNRIVHSYTVLAPKRGRKTTLPVDPTDGSYEYLAGPGLSKYVLASFQSSALPEPE